MHSAIYQPHLKACLNYVDMRRLVEHPTAETEYEYPIISPRNGAEMIGSSQLQFRNTREHNIARQLLYVCMYNCIYIG